MAMRFMKSLSLMTGKEFLHKVLGDPLLSIISKAMKMKEGQSFEVDELRFDPRLTEDVTKNQQKLLEAAQTILDKILITVDDTPL